MRRNRIGQILAPLAATGPESENAFGSSDRAAVGSAADGLEREWSGHARPKAHFAGILTVTLLCDLGRQAGSGKSICFAATSCGAYFLRN